MALRGLVERLLFKLVTPGRCGVCDAPIDVNHKDTGTIRFRASDCAGLQEMKICKACGDKLESEALKPEDFDE